MTDIIFLQETLGKVEQVTPVLLSINLGWCFHALDVNGHYGGIALGINTCSINLIST